MSVPGEARRDRPWSVAARALAPLYATAGVLAMWWLSPRVPYADAWRHLGRHVQLPFPADVLAPDNGHHELLPNLVRVLDLRLFDAGQVLQIVVGIALALATLAVYWRGLRRLPERPQRLAGLLAIVLGLFWLGNIRALAHGNESVHAYCVTLFLALGLHALARGRGPAGGAVLAAACGLAATFSFGSGFASFAAFGAVLLLRRAGWPAWAVLAGAALSALVLLEIAGGTGEGARLSPRQLPMLLAWLSGPLVHAAWPALDPDVAAQLPVAAVRVPAQAVAAAYRSGAGSVHDAPWPQLLAGLAGLGWLAVLAWRAWSTRATAMLVGLGTACFALAVGAMIVIVRLDYFEANATQLLAPRYLVWSSLFWAGLLLATAAGTRPTAAGTRGAGRTLVATVLVAALLLPSQAWMGLLGARMAGVAERSALAIAVGVLEPDLELGETIPGELDVALPGLREAQVSVFAWPEARWLGQDWPAGNARAPAVDALDVVPVENRLGPEGRRVAFNLDAACDRLLLIGLDGRVAGLAMRQGRGGQDWIGWMRGTGPLPTRPAACAPLQEQP